MTGKLSRANWGKAATTSEFNSIVAGGEALSRRFHSEAKHFDQPVSWAPKWDLGLAPSIKPETGSPTFSRATSGISAVSKHAPLAKAEIREKSNES